MATKEVTKRQLKMLSLAKRKGRGADANELAKALGRSYYVSLWTLSQVVQAHMPNGKQAKETVDYGVYERKDGERKQHYWVADHVGKAKTKKAKPATKTAANEEVAANGNKSKSRHAA